MVYTSFCMQTVERSPRLFGAKTDKGESPDKRGWTIVIMARVGLGSTLDAAAGDHHVAPAAEDSSATRHRNASTRRTRALVATALAALLAVAGAQLLGPALTDWQSDTATRARETQLAAVDRQLQLLHADTARVVQRARKFFALQHHTQLASSAFSHFVARAQERALTQHAKERLERHAFVMKQAIARQQTQNGDINATVQKLRALNVSLLQPPPERRQQLMTVSKAQLLQLQEIQRRQRALDDSIVSLAADTALETSELALAEQTARQREVDARIAESLRRLEQQIEAHSKRQSSMSGGALFFYTIVTCLTGGYLWMTVTERRRRKPRESWSWSPIPKFMVQIRDLLKSAVVRHWRLELRVDDEVQAG